jgi:hypothetical protein
MLSYNAGLSNFKQGVVYFLVSKSPVMYPLWSYLTLNTNTGKSNATHDKFRSGSGVSV